MNFQELGLTLQRERERKGLSITVVMEATKISRTNIVAMENGDRATLPHPVYAKGFVKSYARYLGLDADELSMVVDREYQDEAGGPEEHVYEVSPAAEKAFHEKDATERKKTSSWLFLLAALVLAAIVVFFVMNYTGKDDVESAQSDIAVELADEATQSAPVTPEQEVEESAEPVVPATPAAENAADEADIPAVDEPEQPDVPVIPEVVPEKPEPPVVKKVEQTKEKITAEDKEKQKYDHILIIRATTEKGCWIGVWKGDETQMARDFVLTEGEPLRLMFNSPRRIRIGNVAGVTVTYNGDTYPLNTARGNIQTLRFGE